VGDSAAVTVQGLCGEMAEVVGEVGRNCLIWEFMLNLILPRVGSNWRMLSMEITSELHFKKEIVGMPGCCSWFVPTLGFGSGHGLAVIGSSPASISALSAESASASLPLSLQLMLSLSQTNK